MSVSLPSSLAPLTDAAVPRLERIGAAVGGSVGSLLSSGIDVATDLAGDVADFAADLAADLVPSREHRSAARRLAPWALLAITLVAIGYVVRRRRDAGDDATT